LQRGGLCGRVAGVAAVAAVRVRERYGQVAGAAAVRVCGAAGHA